MHGCNPLRLDQLTKEEVERLYGCVVGERFWIKNELHEVRSVDPLTLHPIWD